MGTFKKILGAVVLTGAAVGGALYLKKRKQERESGVYFDDIESLKDKKMVEVLREDENGTISVTINTKKLKATTDKAADKVLDASMIAKESIKDTIGEDNIQAAKDTFNKVKDVSVEAVNNAKDFVVDTIGEDNINTIKEKVSDVVDTAKEKVSDVMDSTKEKVVKAMDNAEDKTYEMLGSEDDFEDEYLEDELKEF